MKDQSVGGCWILHEEARKYHWHGTGSLSIKAFFRGRAHYKVACGYHAVDENSYLVLNEGQSYSISIESREPVESFCLFFAPGFAEEVERSLSLKSQRLLDEPNAGRARPIRFFERNYAHDETLSPALFALRKMHDGLEGGELLERFYGIMERLLAVHAATAKEPERFSNMRRTTREELYRRVYRARDYASALFAQPLTLTDLARVACLSPNHLLRSFRQAFGTTPHQFLRTRRLEEAKRLLASGESVTQVCLAVGFESLGSFSRLFRRSFGVTPTEFQKGDFGEAV